MAQTKQKKVRISTELSLGLVTVLKNASTQGKLRGRDRKLAAAYVGVLENEIAKTEGKARVRFSVHMVANILRIILLVLRPDPLIRAAIEFLSHGI